MNEERFNELKQFAPEDARIILALKELGEIEQITVHHVDFTNGDVFISIDSNEKDFEGVMDSIMFCAVSKRMQIKSADFDTGEIKIQWLPDLRFGLTQEEISLVKQNKKIGAIKALRSRTHVSLAEAKRMIEENWDSIRNGVLQ